MLYSIIGQVLLWVGFLGAALAAVFRLELSEHPWQTISWPIYLAWMVVGWAGVAVLRYHRASLRKQLSFSQIGSESILEKLRRCSSVFDERLAGRIHELTCEQVLEVIDADLAPLMADFADDSKVMTFYFGTAAYTEIMTEFACGERYLNRAWSAAADGYVDEVTKSVQIAGDFLKAAVAHAEGAVQIASSRG